jgi:cystathionine beta-lyase
MTHDFNTFPSRKNTACVKWDAIPSVFGVKKEDDVLPFWVADMDFSCPQPIIDALKQRVDHGIFGYTMVSDDFKGSVVRWMKKRHHSELDASWIRFSPGVLHGLSNAILALSQEGDKVIIQTPVYYPFNSIIEEAGRFITENPLIEKEGTYLMDFEDLEVKASDPKTKLMILCNPHNPIGRVYTREELMKVAEICARHQVIVLADEIHADLIFKPYTHVSFMSLPDDYKSKALVFVSPSKTFNLAGLQTSSVIIPDVFAQTAYDKAAAKTRTTGINVFGETAMVAAYDQCESYVDELMDYLSINLAYVRETIKTRFPMLSLFEPQGTYLLWIDFRNSGVLGKDLEDFMSKTVKIGVDDGSWFGEAGTGFIRLNIACPRTLLEEAFDRLEKALYELK